MFDGEQNNTSAQFSRTYNSFSGVDIHAVFGDSAILEIQGISFTVSREKAPIYTMGHANPRAFCRGKRGIAGTVIFTVFDRQALLEQQKSRKFWADQEELTGRSQALSAGQTSVQRAGGASMQDPLSLTDKERGGLVSPSVPWYEDQILPFNIILVALNEYGHQMKMEIRGCEILNQGQGISVDDLMIDQQMTFVATDIYPWVAGTFSPASIHETFHPSLQPPGVAAK
jgi:hypothetical protein